MFVLQYFKPLDFLFLACWLISVLTFGFAYYCVASQKLAKLEARSQQAEAQHTTSFVYYLPSIAREVWQADYYVVSKQSTEVCQRLGRREL